jgi:hypothetical protein
MFFFIVQGDLCSCTKICLYDKNMGALRLLAFSAFCLAVLGI